MVVNRPKVVVAMGGGICVPFAYIAWLLRIPVVSLEQNVVPGKATRYIQWVAASIITSFAETNHHLIKKHAQFLGNPLRVSYPSDPNSDQLNQLTGNSLVVVGGSQGASGINDWCLTIKKKY